ncbi:MAG: HlyD family secretion protein [Rhodospirillales bacterium]
MADTVEPQAPAKPPENAPAQAPAKAPDNASAQAREAAQSRQRAAARPFVRIGMVIVLIALVGGGLYYWYTTRNEESTDDAYTDGRAVPIASHVNGFVIALDVNDNQFVRKGDPLVHIDPRDYQAALEGAQGQLAAARGQLAASQHGYEIAQIGFPARLAQAEAQLKDAEANQFKAQTDYNRQKSLPRAATTLQQIDYAEAALRSAEAQVANAQAAVQLATPVQPNIRQSGAQVKQLGGSVLQAEAAVRQAQLNLDWCMVKAPQDGWVTKRNVEVGTYVQQGVQIMSLVSPEVWVTANFKEGQLKRMRPGQPVAISIDAYPQLNLRGHVDSLQLGSGSKFTAFPPENATGNFVKIVQRLPVKVVIDSGLDPNLPLPLGLSAVPTVTVQ